MAISGTFVTEEICFWDKPWVSMSKHRLCKAQAWLHNLFVRVWVCVFGTSLSSFVLTGSLCDVLKEFGSFPSPGRPHEGPQTPPSALAPWLRMHRDLWRHTREKINKKMSLKSSHWHSTIYIFPMGHHCNGCSLRSSMKALYTMSSSAAYLPLAIN